MPGDGSVRWWSARLGLAAVVLTVGGFATRGAYSLFERGAASAKQETAIKEAADKAADCIAGLSHVHDNLADLDKRVSLTEQAGATRQAQLDHIEQSLDRLARRIGRTSSGGFANGGP